MRRRSFIKATGLSACYLVPVFRRTIDKTHIISLSFDDGFKKSFYRIAEIHENYGLQACLNVIASGHLPSFKAVDSWILPELMGDFNDWNKLKARGHEVMPHTWEHLNLTKVPIEKAKENMDKCFEYFEENLDGYTNAAAVYNFAFNASTTELEDYALSKVSAVRTAGWIVLKNTKFNLIESGKQRLGCWSYGPDYGDARVEEIIEEFLAAEGGWLILNLHGLDGEGWGPIHSTFLDNLLKKMINLKNVAVMPTAKVIESFQL